VVKTLPQTGMIYPFCQNKGLRMA